MNEENFLVKFVPVKHCFLQFSSKWFYKINNPKYSCLRLVHPESKQKLYFSWAPQPSSVALNDCSVGINATFAQALNLQEGELVVISSEESVVSLHQIYLTPVTADDYEILELSRDNVEVSLLNQIRIIFVGQVIVVWVSKTMHLKLTVDRLEPNLPQGRLEELSELIIQNVSKPIEDRNFSVRNRPFVSNTDTQSSNNLKQETSYWGLLADYLPSSVLGLLKSKENQNQPKTEKSKSDSSEMLCRVHPFPRTAECCNSAHDEHLHPFNVFVSKRTLQKQTGLPRNSFVSYLLNEQNAVALCRLEVIPKRKPKMSKKAVENTKEDLSNDKQSICVCVRLYRIEESCCVFNKSINVSCVFVSKFLRRVLELSIGRRVRLQAYEPVLSKTLSEITLVPARKLGDEESKCLVRQFEERFSCRDGVLVNDCFPFPIPQPNGPDLHVLVVLLPGELDCWPLTRSELQVTVVNVSADVEKNLENLQGYDEEEEKHSRKSSVFENLMEQGVATLEYGLQLVNTEHPPVTTNILITGKQGSGKSRLAEAIYTAVSGAPYHVFVSVLDCKPLKGKKPESICKIVTDHVEECVHHQPALLVLEDLQSLATAPTNNSEPSQENMYYMRLATLLKELLWQMRGSLVAVVATAEARTLIHPQLLAARGRHFFTSFLNIPPLSKADRLNIIKDLLTARLPSPTIRTLPDLDEAAARTEGCVARDLHRLVDRLLFRACQRQAQAVEVTAGDLAVALQNFVPSDLINVSVTRHSSHTFASVGGLRDAKRQLTEVLIWPNKYPEVFSQCPLRLERGVLLYGAPGTGKTLLASAVVGESGLNFITVKGPELLSKYIGASEEAVRNVFQKAQSARPCILFFDEFDSLAPRRGHDSTGVTDRVVNQLLTQMDGVEALEGVWVVAAASRPDLLDPALLRPGRMGNLVHCPTPDQLERAEILQSLSTRLRLSDDVDLADVAARTEGYTGADLQAVLFTAQMIAYDALHQDSDDEAQTSAPPADDVVVGQSNLLAALQDTLPSLKPGDRIRFQQIYDQFQKFRGTSAQESTAEPTLRVTLA